MTSKLILASGSPIRATLLQQSGIDFEIVTAAVDEDMMKAAMLSEQAPHRDIADKLAEIKALKVSQKNPENLVLGCDQILACDEVIYSKPQDHAMAKAQLMALSGKTHQLFSAAVLYRQGARIWHHLAIANITMRRLDESFIDAYLNRLGAAAFSSPASYQIETIGAQLLSRIDGCHFAILGLPLLELLGILREHGLKPVDAGQ